LIVDMPGTTIGTATISQDSGVAPRIGESPLPKRVSGESGRLDLNQRPFGPQPHGPSAAESTTPRSSQMGGAEVTQVAFSLDPKVDPELLFGPRHPHLDLEGPRASLGGEAHRWRYIHWVG
jgi:hypothetical protein